MEDNSKKFRDFNKLKNPLDSLREALESLRDPRPVSGEKLHPIEEIVESIEEQPQQDNNRDRDTDQPKYQAAHHCRLHLLD
jgi:hypothetical protein